MFKNFLLVGLGGAIGSMLRYAISLLITVKHFPYSTFIVNIAIININTYIHTIMRASNRKNNKIKESIYLNFSLSP